MSKSKKAGRKRPAATKKPGAAGAARKLPEVVSDQEANARGWAALRSWATGGRSEDASDVAPEQDEPGDKEGLSFRFQFSDGSTGTVPFSKAMAARDRHLKAAAVIERDKQRGSKTKGKPRPSRRSPLRRRLGEVLAQERGTEFKVLMKRWETEPIRGLRLTLDANLGKYLVTDEDSVADSAAHYTFETLNVIWSEG